ncbi:thiamine-phosphate kinase [Microlunatus capsulatus]|uniref:Thiamine-monophosphate kinase n=1 Tax=Microlunatus capsulatus TaxID=99117 RepID=A0ABS4ZCQ5_9ACTN|nr:thiamine-phosphate kinase [Microlunatus capsulatus]MBP2418826.1 thiamine-monophosphate kinase [Microlunatus capsulatus]
MTEVAGLPGTATLAEIGERAVIATLTADLPPAADVLVGPGDDGAVLEVAGPLVTSLDVLVQDVHFKLGWSDPADIGRKAVAVNVADLEAMGARATAVVLGFSAPPHLQLRWVRELAGGLRAECAAAGVSLVGGDVTRARDLTLSVTVLGGLEGRPPVLRSGARAGDVVALRGRTGWAAAGLAVLSRGFRSPRAVVEAQRVPQVPYGQGVVAARAGATAMVDVSDGLLADLGHVARASGVVVDLRQDAFEVPEPLQAVSAATGADPYDLLLTGGEDHALAATFPAGAVPEGWRVVGEVRAAGEDEGAGVLVDGRTWAATGGFDHFGGGR